MLNFSAARVRYEPYPLVVLRPAVAPDLYDELCNTYPDTSLFGTHPKYDHKLSLSEKFMKGNYNTFIERTRPWKEFHGWLKSEEFIRATLGFLESVGIDLDVAKSFEPVPKRIGRALGAMVKDRRLPSLPPRLRSRFEFSVLEADGGEVAPHTDTPKKIVTLVLSMVKKGEWDPAIGGGLDVNRSLDPRYAFNWNNRSVPWESVEVLETIPFVPNQCIVFVKTFNSLHSVRPMRQKGFRALRKSVTIVIEKDE
jgi:hypothetical protein